MESPSLCKCSINSDNLVLSDYPIAKLKIAGTVERFPSSNIINKLLVLLRYSAFKVWLEWLSVIFREDRRVTVKLLLNVPVVASMCQ